MRFWPFRRRRVALPSADSTAFTVAELAPQLAGVLAVDQVRAEGHAVAFGGRRLAAPATGGAPLGPRSRALRATRFVPARHGGPDRVQGPRSLVLPALRIGVRWWKVGAVPAGESVAFGDSLLLRFMTWLSFGRLPPGHDVFVHPVALAGWVGLFVTALNLIPVGQLDGGRIAYALFGARHRQISIATFVALLALGAVTGAGNWFVW